MADPCIYCRLDSMLYSNDIRRRPGRISMDKEQILENVSEHNGLLFCLVWWKHDECLMLEELLREITGDPKYDHPRQWADE
jgi:hypothetical protein